MFIFNGNTNLNHSFNQSTIILKYPFKITGKRRIVKKLLYRNHFPKRFNSLSKIPIYLVSKAIVLTLSNNFFRCKDGLFELVWDEDGTVTLKANNDKFIGTKKSGHLFANRDAMDENTKYYFYLINRPVLVLKCDQGFVGYKSSSSTRLECNKATYETIVVERTDKGMVHLKGMYRHAKPN